MKSVPYWTGIGKRAISMMNEEYSPSPVNGDSREEAPLTAAVEEMNQSP
jgi:hypothetical protein